LSRSCFLENLFPVGVVLAPVASGGLTGLLWFPVGNLGVSAGSGDDGGWLLWPVTGVEWDDGSVWDVVLVRIVDFLGSFTLLEFLLLDFLGSSVEEKIGHDLSLPLGGSVEGASESEDLSGESPPDQTDGVGSLVVAWDGDIDKLGRRVGVAKSNDGDVDVRGFSDWLMIDSGIGDDEESGLSEGALVLVSERTGGVSAGNWGSSGLGGELEDGSLSLGLARDDGDISWVLDGSDGSGGEHELLPGLAEVEDVVLGLVAAVNVLAHSVIVVDVSEVDSGGDHSADVGLGGSKNGQVGGHLV